MDRAGAAKGSGLYTALGPRFVDGPPSSAAFALRPLRVAQDLGWCEYDYPRWGGHTSEMTYQHFPCLAHRLLSWGRSANLRPFALPRPDALSPHPRARVAD